MCEHDHNHHHSDEQENNKLAIAKLVISIVIFVTATILHPTGLNRLLIYFSAYLIAGGDVVLKAIKHILKGKVFDENFLMVLATVGALAIGEYPEAVMVMVLYQIGEMLQDYAVEKSKKSISSLMNIRPDYANIVVNSELIKKKPEDVKIGDTIVVKTGEKIPLDGIVINGHASIDTSALTGESVPKCLKTGDNAVSGCINTNGVLTIKVEKEFGESTVSKILELVEHASSKKAKAENFITKFARYYTPAVVFGAVALAILPPLFIQGAQFSTWLQRALTFLVISCPCALVISVPLGFFAGIGGASRNGILIKGACYIEALSKPYTVVFDKTGTLTKGTFAITSINPVKNITTDYLLKVSAYAENYSNHPIASSIKNAFAEKIDKDLINNVEEIAGNGVKATVNGKEILAGNCKLMKMFNIAYIEAENIGASIYIAENGKFIGSITISDELKSDSKLAIEKLNKKVKQTVMLTGDSKTPAEYVAKELGIKNVYSELLPSQKVEKLEELIEAKQGSVIFVGDGINDAPVLTRADVGIAMGGLGSDSAIEASDVVIMTDEPSKVSKVISIAHKTMTIVKENIAFALGIKALFLILGAFGFVTMWGAVFADVGVTLIAVINSLRALKE
mgnify:FL=1